MSDSLRPHGLYGSCSSPGQNTTVGSLSLLQGNLPTPGTEPRSPTLQADSLPAESQGKPMQEAMQETWVGSLGWEDPLERERLSTPVFWAGEFHGLYSPWGRKKSDMTERLSLLQYFIVYMSHFVFIESSWTFRLFPCLTYCNSASVNNVVHIVSSLSICA